MSQAIFLHFNFDDTPFQMDHGLKRSTLSSDSVMAGWHFYRMDGHNQFI